MSTDLRRFGDIALKDAMIAWNPRPYGDGRIAVIPHPDEGGWTNLAKLSDTTGACWCYWGSLSKKARLAELYREAWQIACRDGIALPDIHSALSVIPEYRESLRGELFFRTSTGGSK